MLIGLLKTNKTTTYLAIKYNVASCGFLNIFLNHWQLNSTFAPCASEIISVQTQTDEVIIIVDLRIF